MKKLYTHASDKYHVTGFLHVTSNDDMPFSFKTDLSSVLISDDRYLMSLELACRNGRWMLTSKPKVSCDIIINGVVFKPCKIT